MNQQVEILQYICVTCFAQTTMSRAPTTLPQPTGCRTSQTSTFWLVCRKPVSTEECFWWLSLGCTLNGGCSNSCCIFLRFKAGLLLHTHRRSTFTERPWGETDAAISLQHRCWKYRWLHSRKSNWGILFLLLAARPVVTDLFLLSVADIRS